MKARVLNIYKQNRAINQFYSATQQIHHVNKCFTTITVDRQDKSEFAE